MKNKNTLLKVLKTEYLNRNFICSGSGDNTTWSFTKKEYVDDVLSHYSNKSSLSKKTIKNRLNKFMVLTGHTVTDEMYSFNSKTPKKFIENTINVFNEDLSRVSSYNSEIHKRNYTMKVSKKNKEDVSTNEIYETKSENYIAALIKENADLNKKLALANRNNGDVEILFDRLHDAIENKYNKAFIVKPWKNNNAFKKNTSVTAVLHCSDWHIGACENVPGKNVFNYSVAVNRVETLVGKYIAWIEMHRSAYNIDELVIIDTGDNISGDIHDELKRSNEFTPPEQVEKAATLKAKMISELAKHFKKVRIEFISPDNHSRCTKKLEWSDGKNYYNYLVGKMCKWMLDGNENIEFNVYTDNEKIISIRDVNYLVMHGHTIRGGYAGIPWYSVQRRIGLESSIRMNMDNSEHFSKIIMGHYHVPHSAPGIAMTGSLCGTTAYDEAAGRHSRACQSGWIVGGHDDFDRTDFWLD